MAQLHYHPITGRAEEMIEAALELPALQAVPEQSFTFRLVLEELLVNIVNYAYPPDVDGEVTIDVDNVEGCVVIRLTDRGVPFDPLARETPDTTLPLEQRPIGGLGIFLVREMMDTVDYEYTDGCNVLTVTKRVAPAE